MHTYACIHVGEVAFQGPPTRQCSLCGFVFACAFYNLFGASVTLINLLAMFCLNCYGFPCLANGSLLGAPYFQRAAKPSEKCHDKWVCFHMVKFLVPNNQPGIEGAVASLLKEGRVPWHEILTLF